MNTIFKYNANGKYSAKDLKGVDITVTIFHCQTWTWIKRTICKNSAAKYLYGSSHCGLTKSYDGRL